jgi:hypothetical protein
MRALLVATTFNLAAAYSLSAQPASLFSAHQPAAAAVRLCAVAPDDARPPQQQEDAPRLPGRPATAAAAKAAGALALSAAAVLGGAPALGFGVREAFAAGQVAAPVAKPLSVTAQKRLKGMLKTKLGKVPVFMVTNEQGSPFLNRLASGDQSALMFLFPGEAQKMLDGVLKAPNGASSGAKVLATNLDRAFKLARLEASPSGLRDQYTNRDLTMVWQFMPHATEQRTAQLLLAKTGKLSAPAVPAYMVDGLVLSKRGKEVRPVFLSKKDADAAIASLDAEEAPKVIVYDALQLILQVVRDIESGAPDIEAELSSLEFVPATESIDFKEQLKADRPKLKAQIVPPSQPY